MQDITERKQAEEALARSENRLRTIIETEPECVKVLGTDGFGRSDYRRKLREFFEVDRRFVALAALQALAEDGKVEASVPADAIRKFGIDPEKPNPAHS